MITVSVCMIVKNEERLLARCLSSLTRVADEIIIVDTGSTDRTKEIAAGYTDKLYDYVWKNDFSDARNFSFSKASMDYIYAADADEILDKTNEHRFLQLKQAMLPEIEIVQMKYTNQLEFGTTYNYETEYRPKLFKRLRKFSWINPIHETVNLEPVIYNSDIEIIHKPEGSHAARDFHAILKVIKSGAVLSKKLYLMYARELYIAGEDGDFLDAEPYFSASVRTEARSGDELKAAQCILTRCGRIKKDPALLLKNSLKNLADGKASAEVCFEVGEHFYQEGDYEEAVIWFYNAAFETASELNIHYAGDYPLNRLADAWQKLGNGEQEKLYRDMAREWKTPEGPNI